MPFDKVFSYDGSFHFLGLFGEIMLCLCAKDGGERHYKATKKMWCWDAVGSYFGVKSYILAIFLLKTAAVRVGH